MGGGKKTQKLGQRSSRMTSAYAWDGAYKENQENTTNINVLYMSHLSMIAKLSKQNSLNYPLQET